MIGLAPGVTTTCSGEASIPFRRRTSSAIAARSGSIPVAAV
jgi:hypothetical protein